MKNEETVNVKFREPVKGQGVLGKGRTGVRHRIVNIQEMCKER